MSRAKAAANVDFPTPPLPDIAIFNLPPAARGPSARGAYMLRKSFVLVFIRFRVKARHHDQGFITELANYRTDPLTH
jgi:hypothetical protein